MELIYQNEKQKLFNRLLDNQKNRQRRLCKGIVHRDLKPENMHLQEEGSNILKIIDLELQLNLNKVLLIIYLLGQYTSDIMKNVIYGLLEWVFYFMLTDRMPFQAKYDSQMFTIILKQQLKYDLQIFGKYSEDCKSLLKLIFIKKEQQRVSPYEIFQHKWFQMQKQQMKMSQQYLQKKCEILFNLDKFRSKNRLQAVVKTFAVCQLLVNRQKNFITQIFRSIEKDFNGVVSCKQLREAICEYKYMSIEGANILISLIDTNCSGDIQYTQFLVANLSNEQFLKKQYFEKAFSYFDTDHIGCISYQEEVKFPQNYQYQSHQIQKMFKQVDSNHDGQIDQQQFIKLFINNLNKSTEKKPMKQLQSIKNLNIKSIIKQQQQNS